MSSTSIITGDSVHGSKLLVHIAENGYSFEIDCDENTLVDYVQHFIESVSGINAYDQLLLCLDMKLEPQNALSYYKLPSPDRELFLFNKVRLQANSLPSTKSEEVNTIEISDPPLPSLIHDPHPLDDAIDPALKALPSYERQFRYHYHVGHAIYSRTQAKYENCCRLLKNGKVQERAVQVARANLEQYYRVVSQNFTDLMKRYSQQYRYHSDILVSFGRDVERLRGCKLHHDLKTGTRKCLLDFVKEEGLRKWVETCTGSHGLLDVKISQFKQKFGEVKQKVEDLLTNKTASPLRNMELMIKEHVRHVDDQKSIMQSLSKDVRTVKKLVDDCLTSEFSISLRPHDAVSALGPMYDVHEKNHLPNMQAFERSISKLLDFCIDEKNEMNLFVHDYMQKIAYMSFVIKDAKLQFHVFKEAIHRQDDLFVNLKLVRKIGPAYRACLAEVVRRRASMKLYMGMAGQLAERLATKRELEVQRRDDFLKTHGAYIPRDVLASMGLYDSPNPCDVNITPFDTNLLDVDTSDLDHYAPEYLVRLPYKSSESEWSAVETLEKYDFEEPLDLSELVEIAGTSKIEVENAKLKSELASAIALICSFGGGDMEYELPDDSSLDIKLKNSVDKTFEALHLKDEYIKHLQSLLSEKQMQCDSYEKRIQEVEQRLSDQYLQGKKLLGTKNEVLAVKVDECKSEISTSEPMEEVFHAVNSLDGKSSIFHKQLGKSREGPDENMLDLSGVLNPQLNLLIPEPRFDELNADSKDKMSEVFNNLPCDKAVDLGSECKISSDELLQLQNALEEKSNVLNETAIKHKDAMEQLVLLAREVEISRKLLDESQMNCAHLENCLHEAREEAQTHLCAADRRASEYSALRVSAVKMRGIFERLRSCVTSAGVSVFADSLRALAQSLANFPNESEDGIAELRTCIQGLADKVGFLSRHRTELLERFSKAEATNKQLITELEEKKELVKTLYTKHQLEKQANKEKISFGRLELLEIAGFALNSSAHYEAINRCSLKYYLSAESVALFTEALPKPPPYIIGQVVHIEHKTVKSSSQTILNSDAILNPFGLPIGCEYFVVTIAMLPETTTSS